MKALLIRLLSFMLATLMLAGLAACGNTPAEEPSEPDGSQEHPAEPKPQTPTGDSTTADGLTLDMFDPTKTYVMPDLSALDMSEYVTLGRYSGLTLTVDYDAITVTDEELDSAIAALLKEEHPGAKITDRAVAWGDTVVADYVGTLDGVAFSGGTAQAQTISLKDNSGYIPGFVEGLVGAEVGKEHAVDVTFPEEYHSAELAGKAVVFTFTVHYIEGNPTLDDAFVTEYTEGAFTDAEEYREALREQMETDAYDSARRAALWTAIIGNAAAKKYPEEAVMVVYADYYSYYSYFAAMYGVDYNTFLASYVGGSAEDLFAYCKEIVKGEMVYHAVFQKEGYSYTDEQYARMLDVYTEENYESVRDMMISGGAEDYTIEQAREYFDRDEEHKKNIVWRCLEESAFNELIATAKIIVNGAPEAEASEESAS